nr:DDE transposase [Dyadobacter fermentans]
MYSENTGAHLSIDETSLSNGELYTIVTNKAAQGR